MESEGWKLIVGVILNGTILVFCIIKIRKANRYIRESKEKIKKYSG